MDYGLPARSQSAVTDVGLSGQIDYMQPACHGIQASKAEKAVEMKYRIYQPPDQDPDRLNFADLWLKTVHVHVSMYTKV